MAATDLYDRIATAYPGTRRADPRIAARIWAALGEARSVVNVGAGTGAYEPTDREVIAIEPSTGMIAQRPSDAAPVIQAAAEQLPLVDGSVDAGMAVLTLHHWTEYRRGF
jgi:SAM-dependent methyltransferase